MSFFSLNFMVLKHILVHMCVLIGTVSQVSNVTHFFLFYLLKAVNFGKKILLCRKEGVQSWRTTREPICWTLDCGKYSKKQIRGAHWSHQRDSDLTSQQRWGSVESALVVGDQCLRILLVTFITEIRIDRWLVIEKCHESNKVYMQFFSPQTNKSLVILDHWRPQLKLNFDWFCPNVNKVQVCFMHKCIPYFIVPN